jgi:7-cyano-7-deazaguanine synthase
MTRNKKAIILSSGGLDSTTAMAVAREKGFELYSLSFDYGQRHRLELEAANKIADRMDVTRHLVINVNMRDIGGSALTGDVDVPKKTSRIGEGQEIPVTYVPARNTIFLSFALAWAEVLGSEDIFIGVNAVDYSGYPDCRPEYIKAFEAMANLATKAGVENKTNVTIHTPLIYMAKAEIIRLGVKLGVDYSLTHSCYDPTPAGLFCGECDSCILRMKGFKEAGMKDPAAYIR